MPCEECGFRPGSIQHIHTLLPSPGDTIERLVLFLATGCACDAPVAPDAGEVDVELVDFNDLRSFADSVDPGLIDAKTFAWLWWLIAN